MFKERLEAVRYGAGSKWFRVWFWVLGSLAVVYFGGLRGGAARVQWLAKMKCVKLGVLIRSRLRFRRSLGFEDLALSVNGSCEKIINPSIKICGWEIKVLVDRA